MLAFTMDEADRIAHAMNEATLLSPKEGGDDKDAQALTREVLAFIDQYTTATPQESGADGTHLTSARRMDAQTRHDFAQRYLDLYEEAVRGRDLG